MNSQAALWKNLFFLLMCLFYPETALAKSMQNDSPHSGKGVVSSVIRAGQHMDTSERAKESFIKEYKDKGCPLEDVQCKYSADYDDFILGNFVCSAYSSVCSPCEKIAEEGQVFADGSRCSCPSGFGRSIPKDAGKITLRNQDACINSKEKERLAEASFVNEPGGTEAPFVVGNSSEQQETHGSSNGYNTYNTSDDRGAPEYIEASQF